MTDFTITSHAIHLKQDSNWAVFNCLLSDEKKKTNISGEWPSNPANILPGSSFRAILFESEFRGQPQYKFNKNTIKACDPTTFIISQHLLNQLGSGYKTDIRHVLLFFGTELPNILDKAVSTNQILVCEGVTPYKMKKILNAYKTISENVKLQKKYPSLPAQWIDLIKSPLELDLNPYVLYDLVDVHNKKQSLVVSDGIIPAELADSKLRELRVQAYGKHVFNTFHRKTGSYWFEMNSILHELNTSHSIGGNDVEELLKAIIVEKDQYVAFYGHVEEERIAAYYINDLKKREFKVSHKENPSLDGPQNLAVQMSMTHSISIITGRAGTGKTYVIKSITEILNNTDIPFMLCAPTGKAAARIKETSQQSAKTIHSLLKADSSLPFYLIIDECSMLSVSLFVQLMSSKSSEILGILFVGDPNQLPSIDPGALLRDMLDSNCISTIDLQKIYRQGEGSAIIHNAGRILTNQSLTNTDQEWNVVFTDTPIEDALLFAERHGLHFQFIVQTNNARNAVNKRLQSLYNAQIFRNSTRWKLDDIVINLENCYDGEGEDRKLIISNGDLGRVIDLSDDAKFVNVKFEHVTKRYAQHSNEIDLAYAITLHKFQGSETENIILILDNAEKYQAKEITYTGVTRARKQVCVFTSECTWQAATTVTCKYARKTDLHNVIKKRIR